MDVQIIPGTYVVAVSGGVDSMALLHLLVQQYGEMNEYQFVVAHFDHGIRSDSAKDQYLVQQVAGSYGLPFVSRRGRLGSGASEDTARQARYKFLHAVRIAHNARAIITAHHQDDMLETAIFNMLRGTNRRGLSSLKNKDAILRPLLDVPKQQLIDYARHHKLGWREDNTNRNVAYQRNYIRYHVLPKASATQRQQLVALLARSRCLNEEIDTYLINYLHQQAATHRLDRHEFIMLPHTVAREIMAAWLRAHDIRGYDTRLLERLVRAAKTYLAGRYVDVNKQHVIEVGKDYLALRSRDR